MDEGETMTSQTAAATKAHVVTKRHRAPRKFAQCPVEGCGRKFFGPRRNQKLGGHNYAVHVRPLASQAVAQAKAAGESPSQLSEINRVAHILALYNELSVKSQEFVSRFLGS